MSELPLDIGLGQRLLEAFKATRQFLTRAPKSVAADSKPSIKKTLFVEAVDVDPATGEATDWRSVTLDYLCSDLCLEAEDAHQLIKSIEFIAQDPTTDDDHFFVRLHQTLASKPGLMGKLTQAALEKAGVPLLPTDELRESVSRDIQNLILHSRDRVDLVVAIESNPQIIRLISDAQADLDRTFAGSRESLLDKMKSTDTEANPLFLRKVTESWRDRENENKLTDDEMARFFEREGLSNQFLTTHLGTARLGLKVPSLIRVAEQFAHSQENYPRFVQTCKSAVVGHIEPRRNPFRKPEFSAENFHFTDGGTSAFHAFLSQYIHDGAKVLITDEEYYEMLEDVDNESRGKLITLPSFDGNVRKYIEDFSEYLSSHFPQFVLVSDFSRRGTPFPLEEIGAVIQSMPEEKRPALIMDSCQSFGRRTIDTRTCQPSAVILSSKKGSDFGGSDAYGGLALAQSFVDLHGALKNPPKLTGTQSKQMMARMRYTCNPESLSGKGLVDSNGNPLHKALFMSVAERHRSSIDSMAKLVQLIQGVNQEVDRKKSGRRIEILSPKGQLLAPNGTADGRRLGAIIECKVEGLDRQTLADRLAGFGIQIDLHDDPIDPDSFRITTHPYMGNEALALIGHALWESCS